MRFFFYTQYPRSYIWSKGWYTMFQILVTRSKPMPCSFYHPYIRFLHLLEFLKFSCQYLMANLVLLSKFVLQNWIWFHSHAYNFHRCFKNNYWNELEIETREKSKMKQILLTFCFAQLCRNVNINAFHFILDNSSI